MRVKRIFQIAITIILIVSVALSQVVFGAEKTENAKPTEPVKQTEPSKQTEPAKPTDHTKPAKPDKPTEPTKPDKPDKPAKPDKPTKPDKPDKPDKPAEHTKPAKPDKPVTRIVYINEYTVALDSYIETCDGKDKKPEVREVYYLSQSDATAGNYSKKIVLNEANYDVFYLDDDGKEVKEITRMGDYTVEVRGKGNCRGTAKATFSLLGKPQSITAEKTKYNISVGETFAISPKADGDGTGFTYKSSDKKVLSVDKRGNVTAKKTGVAHITVRTKGNKYSYPAKLKIFVNVVPDKVKWVEEEPIVKKENSASLAWEKVESAKKYEIAYSKDREFSEEETIMTETKKLKKDIKNLKKWRKYYFKVRAVTTVTDDRGNRYVLKGRWSSVKGIRI